MHENTYKQAFLDPAQKSYRTFFHASAEQALSGFIFSSRVRGKENGGSTTDTGVGFSASLSTSAKLTNSGEKTSLKKTKLKVSYVEHRNKESIAGSDITDLNLLTNDSNFVAMMTV